jgi:twitching motility two-component system response regulator PilG
MPAAHDLNLILEEARGARRVSTRLALESIAESNPTDEVWLWLAWMAASPADGRDYLSKINARGPLAEVAKVADAFLEYLHAPGEAISRINARQKSSGAQYLATCLHCQAQLAVRESALGQSRNCPGCGQSFEIPQSLPIYQESPQLGQVDIYIPAKVGKTSAPVSRTILLVDDSSTVRAVAASSLRKSGYDVVTAESGEEALEKLAELNPGLILLDIKMPGLDGYEVCKRIRSNPTTRDLPVIMLSGKDAFYDKVRGRLAGCNAYITKPCSANVLRDTAAQYLRIPAPTATANT